jgi:eukaryotic-like serine/threonine-protein kinase
MNLPEMDKLKILGQIGTGGRGVVYAARDETDRLVAVKVFDGMAINRMMLVKALGRLQHESWPMGVMKIEWSDMDARPAYWVMPLMSEETEGEEPATWPALNLQNRIDAHPGGDTLDLIKSIASALAELHKKRVAHGNLKPGNVFFDKIGNVQLVDWALVNLPGMNQFEFTDALLYQAPEQLLEPKGYVDEAGYRWDVFSFGVLAYRLLTGKFPRCEEVFREVAPAMGETCKPGIEADLSEIARSLLLEPEITWPSETEDELEKGYRDWIERCLRLLPEDRPTSMIEVSHELSEMGEKVEAEVARIALIDKARHAERNLRRLKLFLGLSTAAMFVFAGLLQMTLMRLAKEQTDYLAEKERIWAVEEAALAAKEKAVSDQQAAEREAKTKMDLVLADLKASRVVGDRLFEWSIETGRGGLSPLDGRELRLAQLEAFYQEFLENHSGVDGLEEELARMRLQLAEISLAGNDDEKSEQHLVDAVSGWQGEMDPQMQLRLAKARLLLAMLKQRMGRENAWDYFVKARTALESVPEAKVDPARLRQLLAILDLYEANWLAKTGEEGKALEQLLRAVRSLNELSEGRPDAAVLRSGLASCYLSSATILEGRGKFGDANEARMLAAKELETLLETDSENTALLSDLAGCYAAIAEASLLAGDTGAAAKFAEDSMKLLEMVLLKIPDSTVSLIRQAVLFGVQGVLMRDQGKSEEALKAFETGITLIEKQPDHPMAQYRLAVLYWQKARMRGFSGENDKEFELLLKADDIFKKLLENADLNGPSRESLNRSRAYLLGDYALAIENSKDKEKAVTIYQEAVAVWEALLKNRPESEEYVAGLEWIKQRLERL